MAVSGSQPVKLGMSICRLFDIRQQTFAADSRPSRRMNPLEHHTQNQTDADAERIGFLIELHCVLEPVLHRCSSYGTDRGNSIAMDLYVVSLPLHPTPGICIGISESPAAWAMTPSAPIDERCGIASQVRNQPLAPFWILFRPGFGYYPGPERRKLRQNWC